MPKTHGVKIILTVTKLSLQFNIKYDTNKQHKHDLVYFSRCPFMDCTNSYVGEIARRPSERVMDHAGRDKTLHINRDGLNSNHKTFKNFKHGVQ